MDNTWISASTARVPWKETLETDWIMQPFLTEFGWRADNRLAKVVERHLKKSKTRAGVASRQGAIKPFLRWLRDQQIDFFKLSVDQAEDYVMDLKREGLHDATVYQRSGAVRRLYEEALQRDWIRRNPFRFIKERRVEPLMRTPALSKEDVELTLAKVHEEFSHYEWGLVARRDYAAIVLMAFTALRSIEVERMRWQDFYQQRDKVMLRVHGKTKESEIRVPPPVMEALCEWREAYERCRNFQLRLLDPVFPSLSPRDKASLTSGKPLPRTSASQLSQIVHRRLADVGITGKRLRAHALRATAATLAIKAGAEVHQVQRLLRHDSLQTTQGYVDWLAIEQADAETLLDYQLPGQAVHAEESGGDQQTH